MAFKLISKESENLTVWLPNGKLKCFKSPEELTDAFVEERLKFYEVRRVRMIEQLTATLNLLNEKVRFIELYLASSQEFSKLTKAALEQLLVSKGFVHIDKLLDIAHRPCSCR